MMQKRRGGDVDQIDVIAPQQRVHVLHVRDPESPCNGLGSGPMRASHRNPPDPWDLRKVLQGIQPEAPGTDDPQPDLALTHRYAPRVRDSTGPTDTLTAEGPRIGDDPSFTTKAARLAWSSASWHRNANHSSLPPMVCRCSIRSGRSWSTRTSRIVRKCTTNDIGQRYLDVRGIIVDVERLESVPAGATA
jgi:hypothetical protein